VSVLLISGSTRGASTNTSLLRTAARLDPTLVLYDALAALPHFNPDDDTADLPQPVADLRKAVAGAEAIVFCTPEYAGTLPGSFKNLLDWLVGGMEIADKPVAWINVAADAHRGGGAISTLETVLGYVQARVVDEACVRIPVARDAVNADGLIEDAGVRSTLLDAIAELRSHASRS
jgi:NAD(P)H-dependent FMN reductase